MDPNVSLRDYQVVDLAFLIAENNGGILHDPGGGKTPPVCVWLYYKWMEKQERSIWVMPKQLLAKNKRELLRFTHFAPQDVAIVDNPKDFHKAANAKVFLMGPRRFTLLNKVMLDAFPDIRNLVGDETHMYWANAKSKDTVAMFDFMETLGREAGFVPMTGSIIKGKLTSAYPLIKVFNPLYYASVDNFMYQHAVMDENGRPLYWTNTEKVAGIISNHCIRRSFESIYGPEAKVIQTELCEMSSEQRTAYKEFEAKAIVELEDGFLEGPTGGVHALRCRQIMSHPETFGLGTSGKDAVLDVHLEDHRISKEPLVIFAAFIAEQERMANLVRAKGMTVALLNGNTPNKERDRIDVAFQAGEIQVVIGSAQVASVGYNWAHCNHMIFPSVDYDDTAFYQAYRRCIRGARATPLRITILEYEDSLDQRIMEIIRKKSALAGKIDGRETYDLSAA